MCRVWKLIWGYFHKVILVIDLCILLRIFSSLLWTKCVLNPYHNGILDPLRHNNERFQILKGTAFDEDDVDFRIKLHQRNTILYGGILLLKQSCKQLFILFLITKFQRNMSCLLWGKSLYRKIWDETSTNVSVWVWLYNHHENIYSPTSSKKYLPTSIVNVKVCRLQDELKCDPIQQIQK